MEQTNDYNMLTIHDYKKRPKYKYRPYDLSIRHTAYVKQKGVEMLTRLKGSKDSGISKPGVAFNPTVPIEFRTKLYAHFGIDYTGGYNPPVSFWVLCDRLFTELEEAQAQHEPLIPIEKGKKK
jgi:hypothetical protein